MIKKLRKKFIAVSMISVFIVLTALIGLINFMNYRQIIDEADETITLIKENGGSMPMMKDRKEPPVKPGNAEGNNSGGFDNDSSNGNNNNNSTSSGGFRDKNVKDHRRAEMFFDTRYFTVSFDGSGNISSSNTDRIAAISGDDAETIAKKIYNGSSAKGFSGNYRYMKVSNDSGTMIICVDCYRSLGNFRSFLLYSVLVSIAGLVLVFLLVLVLSGRVVKPVAESYEKQKQFITDAGHELKTPLAVIDADLSVLEMEGTKNEWTDDIRQQSKRLAGLTNELVYLSRMDEGRKLERIEFPLSDVVSEEVQSFESRAKVEGKTLTRNIQSGISYDGDQKMIRELVSILMDNAVKYSSDSGSIDVSLKKAGNGVELETRNTVDSVTQEQADKMFDRFYRADSSRSEKSGYGLGLSIAKAVCEAHGGSIRAEALPGGKELKITAKF